MVTRSATNNSVVAIAKAEDYSYDKVHLAVARNLELIGGIDKIVKPGDKVLVKINHLAPPSPPEKGIVTHPVFVKAVVDILKTTGARVIVGDDIGSAISDQPDQEGISGFQTSGIYQICQESQVELANLTQSGFVDTPCNGQRLDNVYVSRLALEADVIVNLPKLKTHYLTVYTGSIKNMFGTLPKGIRVKYHRLYNRNEDFSQMLVDVFSIVKPHLTIMDGIVAMEGAGPAAGSLRNPGIVLTSTDGVALDATATKIIGLEPMSIFTTRYAHERGLGQGDLKNINIAGESIVNVAVSKFKLPETKPITRISSRMPGSIAKNVEKIYTYLDTQDVIKPRVITESCIGCEECRKTCPANAITMVKNRAVINRRVCISCFCCHEVCRSNAILVRRSLSRKAFNFFVLGSIGLAGRLARIVVR